MPSRSDHTDVAVAVAWQRHLLAVRRATEFETELVTDDLHPLYPAWLSALTRWELHEYIDGAEDKYTSTVEPPVPTGLAQLAGQHQALADFLHVDPHLLTAAARASGPAPSQAIDKDALTAWIRALPQRGKDTLLLDAALGPPRNRVPPCRPPPRRVPRRSRTVHRRPGAAQPQSSSTPPTRCAASPSVSGNRPTPRHAEVPPVTLIWTA